MRRAPRIDANHAAVASAFRAMGCSVLSLAAVGKGCPDLVIGVAGRNLLCEVKDGLKSPSRRRLTPKQAEFKASWRGSVLYVDDVGDVPTIVNAMRSARALTGS